MNPRILAKIVMYDKRAAVEFWDAGVVFAARNTVLVLLLVLEWVGGIGPEQQT